MIPTGEHAVLASRYVLVRMLGRGSMGTVYLATDQMLKEHPVAIKVLHPELMSDGAHVERFLREVALTRLITHENVVRTYDCGRSGDQLFFTMEYVDGSSLKDRVDAERPPIEEMLSSLQSMSSGLAAIHRAGIIHRDLKLGNVLVSRDGVVKITDFGVARPNVSHLTRTAEVLGSAAYIAPEVWEGKEASDRSDIYSLGILAYELLLGRLPFAARSPAEAMYCHLKAEIPALSSRDPSIPGWVSEIVTRMIVKQPAERPTAEEVYRIFATKDLGAVRSPVDTVKTPRVRLPFGREAGPLLSPPARRALLAGLLSFGVAGFLATRQSGASIPRRATSPSDVPSLAAWFDAGSLPAGARSGVANWPSAHRGAPAANQPVPAARPTLVLDALAGRAAVRFDGVDDHLVSDATAASLRGSTSMTVLHVSRSVSSSQHQYVWSVQQQDKNLDIARGGFSAKGRARIKVGFHRNDIESDEISITDFAVWSAVVEPDRVSVYRNGVKIIQEVSAVPPAIDRAAHFSIGQEYDAGLPTDFFRGEMAELVVYSRALANEERRFVEKVLAQKYGFEPKP